MNAYRPFLLPLAAGFPAGEAAMASNPLQEERLLLQQGDCDWAQLAIACLQTYGMALLLDVPEGKVRTIELNGELANAIRLEGEGIVYIILEHPDQLPLFDAIAAPGDRPALIRPSRFNALQQALQTNPHERSDILPHSSETVPVASFLGAAARRIGISDWHMEACREGYRIRERVDGQLLDRQTISHDSGTVLLNALLREAGMGDRATGIALEGSFTLQDTSPAEAVAARLSVIPTLYGQSAVVRFLPDANTCHPDLAALGMGQQLAAALAEQMQQPDGLWLCCGPTGSGKSTTLQQLAQISVNQGEKVMAVEDPVELTQPGVIQVSIGSIPGMTFASALKAFLRHAPQCILIGEIRDPDSAGIVLQAVRTGHRVLSSVHAHSQNGVFSRFDDLGIRKAELISLQPLVLHQRLIATLCPHCSQQTDGWPLAFADQLASALPTSTLANLPAHTRMRSPAGCNHCEQGYRGRKALFRAQTPGRPELLPPFATEVRQHLAAGYWDPQDWLPLLFGPLPNAFTLSLHPALC